MRKVIFPVTTFKRCLSTTKPSNNKLKLYGFPLSQPTRSILFLCDENNIDYEMITVDALKGDTRKAEFRAAFPSGQVPVIDDNGFKLGEAGAILMYLCEKHSLDHWLPSKDLQTRALIQFWMHWHHTHTRSGTMKLMVLNAFPPKNIPLEVALAGGKREFERSLKFLETSFVSNPRRFLASDDHPSIADLLLLPEIDQHYPDASNLIDYTPYPHIQQWVEEVRMILLSSYHQNFQGVIERTEYIRNRKQQP